MRDIVLCDIDGVLANDSWRRPLIEEQGWDAYFDQMHRDPPLTMAIDVVRALKRSGARICCITGRPERYGPNTIAWLLENGVYFDTIWLRADNDHSPAPLMKMNLLRQNMGEYWPTKILLAMEDHAKTIEAFRERGVFVWQF